MFADAHISTLGYLWRNTKILTFGPILASLTLKAVSLQLNGMLMMWKIQQAMQDDAIRTARIHPAIHTGNRDEVLIWRNFQPAYLVTKISVGETKISGTEPARALI